MKKPENLLPGDVLLYLNHGWLGNLISWGQWNGTPGEALEYSHVGLVLDDLYSVEMNPPASRKFPLSEVPWDRVHVYRLGLGGRELFTVGVVQEAFRREALRRLGERYHYGYIATALGASLLARVGLGGASRWLLNRANPMPGMHRDVCSTWTEEVLTAAVKAHVRQFDLFPNLGDNRARPSDYPMSPFLAKVTT